MVLALYQPAKALTIIQGDGIENETARVYQAAAHEPVVAIHTREKYKSFSRSVL